VAIQFVPRDYVISPYLEAGIYGGLENVGKGVGDYLTPQAEKARRENRIARIEAVLAGDPEFRDRVFRDYDIFYNPILGENQKTPEYVAVPKGITTLADIQKIPGIGNAMTDWQQADVKTWNPSTALRGRQPLAPATQENIFPSFMLSQMFNPQQKLDPRYMMQGGLQAFAKGGKVGKPVPIIAHENERVIQANADQVPGLGKILDQLIVKLREIPSYAEGGTVKKRDTKEELKHLSESQMIYPSTPQPISPDEAQWRELYRQYLLSKSAGTGTVGLSKGPISGLPPSAIGRGSSTVLPGPLSTTTLPFAAQPERFVSGFGAWPSTPPEETQQQQNPPIQQQTQQTTETAVPTSTQPILPVSYTQSTPQKTEPPNYFRYISPLAGGAVLDPTKTDLGTLISHELARGIPVTEVGGKSSSQQQQDKIANVISVKTGLADLESKELANKLIPLQGDLLRAQANLTNLQSLMATSETKSDPLYLFKAQQMVGDAKNAELDTSRKLVDTMIQMKLPPEKYAGELVSYLLKQNPALAQLPEAELRKALGMRLFGAWWDQGDIMKKITSDELQGYIKAAQDFNDKYTTLEMQMFMPMAPTTSTTTTAKVTGPVDFSATGQFSKK